MNSQRTTTTARLLTATFMLGAPLKQATAEARYNSATAQTRYEHAKAPAESQLRKDLEWRCFVSGDVLRDSVGLVVSQKETVSSAPKKASKASWVVTFTSTTAALSLDRKGKSWKAQLPAVEGTAAQQLTLRSDPETWDLLVKVGTGAKQSSPAYWVCPYTLSKKLEATPQAPCGASRLPKERIEQCHQQQIGTELSNKSAEPAREWTWLLATRTKELVEVWLQQDADLLWSSTLPGRSTFDEAEKLCASASNLAPGLEGLTWRLPTTEEWESADKARIGLIFSARPTYEDHDAQSARCSASGLDFCDDLRGRTLWSSFRLGELVMVYDGSFGGLTRVDLKDEKQSLNAVKCVAEFDY
jgi:hypothetical protein